MLLVSWRRVRRVLFNQVVHVVSGFGTGVGGSQQDIPRIRPLFVPVLLLLSVRLPGSFSSESLLTSRAT